VESTGDIAVVGGGENDRSALVAMLHAAGVSARAYDALALDGPGTAPPLLIVTGDVVTLCGEARDVPLLADVPILAVVPAVPTSAGTDALAAGATDIIILPVGAAVFAARVRNLLRGRRSAGAWAPGSLAPQLLRIQDLLTQGGDDANALVSVLEILAETLGFPRASLLAHVEGSEHAFVIAATDDPTRSQFTLSIEDYPEVAECIRTNAAVLLDDAQEHELTAAVAPKLAARGVRAIAVLPVSWRGRPVGVILLRKQTAGVGQVGGRGTDFARLVAALMAGHLRHGPVLESLRDQTHRISRVRYEAERRLRGIESLKEHFEAASDGVVILDDAGRILFVNRAAERITGFARDGLLGSELADLVVPAHRDLTLATIQQVLASRNIDPFDLELATTTGGPATVSVSTSTVLSKSGAVILTFRDVTAQRALETELRSTKEFLERLIDSTVDAIIAADMRGTIILFNQGAERLFQLSAHEVLGKLPVWDLYPEGVARQVMRMLRSTSYGGVGRLEQTRREIRTRAGEVIPVTMTASIVYEGDRETATVGIISDLRERIRIEQRLLQAQEKLQITEKQALVAELAGAAAHELNQPLTSIMGYAQLIQRQSQEGASHLRAVGIILSEAERMADIVKKIGRITKYETTEYVGTASIIDLDRSAAGPDSVPPGVISGTTTSPDATPTESRMARDESVDDEGLTREFAAVRAPAEMIAALGELGFDDPALDRLPSVGAPVPRLPPLRPATAPVTGGHEDGDSTTAERGLVASSEDATTEGTDTQPSVTTTPAAEPEGRR
jgi:PAS domain S-box-containing protein